MHGEPRKQMGFLIYQQEDSIMSSLKFPLTHQDGNYASKSDSLTILPSCYLDFTPGIIIYQGFMIEGEQERNQLTIFVNQFDRRLCKNKYTTARKGKKERQWISMWK